VSFIVKGLVRNRKLAKSIYDAGWSTFRGWLEYFGVKYGKVTVAVPAHYTSQECSNCGQVVKKTLSERTHICSHCGYLAARDVVMVEREVTFPNSNSKPYLRLSPHTAPDVDTPFVIGNKVTTPCFCTSTFKAICMRSL